MAQEGLAHPDVYHGLGRHDLVPGMGEHRVRLARLPGCRYRVLGMDGMLAWNSGCP